MKRKNWAQSSVETPVKSMKTEVLEASSPIPHVLA